MRKLIAAVVSGDPDLRRAIRDSGVVEVATEIPYPPTEVGHADLEALQGRALQLLLIDLGDDVEPGLQLVEFLATNNRERPVLVTGPAPSAELLLQVIRAGAGEYVETPLEADALRGAIARLGRRIADVPLPGSETTGHLVSFVGVKGGVGTTMLAANVAVALRRRSGLEVLLADLHLGLGDAAVHLGLTPRFDLADLLENLHRLDAGLLASYLATDDIGVQLLASPGEVQRVEAVAAGPLAELLQHLRHRFPFCIVDAGDPFSPSARTALARSDRVIVVATPEVAALRNVARVLALLRAAGTGAEVRLALNRFAASRSIPTDEVERLVGLPVSWTISDDAEVTRSINEGAPRVLGRSAVSRELARIADDLLAGTPVTAAPDAGSAARPPLLRRVLGGLGRRPEAP